MQKSKYTFVSLKYYYSKIYVLLILIGTGLITSCGGNSEDPFSEINPLDSLKKEIITYHKATTLVPNNFNSSKSNIPSVYLDFSPGTNQAFENPENKEFFKGVIDGIDNKDINWKKLSGGEIKELSFATSELYTEINKNENYKEIDAPISDAIKQIDESNGEAMIISDCEDKRAGNETESLDAFAEKYFTNWLKKGNQIDFYVKDYIDKGNPKIYPNCPKHLFYIIFTPLTKIGEENSLLNHIKSGLKIAGISNSPILTLSTKFYQINQEYQTEKSSGLKSELADPNSFDQDNYVNDKIEHIEYLPINLSPKYILGLLKEGDNHLTRKLFLDLSHDNAYKIKSIDIMVYDIYDDYIKLFKSETASKHKPILTKDQSGNPILSENNDSYSLFCYKNDGVLKDEFKFSKNSMKPKNEIFKLDNVLFENGLKANKDKCELAISFHPNFNGTQISSERENLIRIDIVIKDCEENFQNKILDDHFVWPSLFKKGETNISIKKSILQALKSVNPKGTIIYTYYIKFLGNDIENQ